MDKSASFVVGEAPRRSSSSLGRMNERPRTDQSLMFMDAIVAVIMAVGAGYFFYISREAAAEAVRLYGRNVDSGALESIGGGLYCVPNVALFTLSSIAMWRRWRLRRLAQSSAMFWLIGPVCFSKHSMVAKIVRSNNSVRAIRDSDTLKPPVTTVNNDERLPTSSVY
jgi:hypothetical protein